MTWVQKMKWIVGLFILILSYQNCSPNKFSTENLGAMLAGIRNQDGQVFDGKLRILHHIVDGYTCEGRLVPESILIRETNGTWTWIQNNTDKCAAQQLTLNPDLISYNEATKTAVYDGKTYVPPRPYNVSAAEDPNLGDVNLKDGVCANINGQCSLRAAVDQAGTTAGTDSVVVNIPSGSFTLNNPLKLILDSDAKAVKIQGAGAQNTILDGADASAHFSLHSLTSALVSIEKMTLQNGRDPSVLHGASIQINPSPFFLATPTAPNAGISISDCIFRNNKNAWAVVYMVKDSGSLQIHRSQFVDNGITAVQVKEANGLLIEDSTFARNSDRGVALSDNAGAVLIQNSSFSENYEGLNLLNCGDCRLENISVYRNRANGIWLFTSKSNPRFNVGIKQATLYDNVTEPMQGQIRSNLSYGFSDPANSLTISNSIVAMAPGSAWPSCMGSPGATQNMVATQNIFSDNSCNAFGTGNLVVDPMLSAAADNGGLTPTLLPLAGSPAIDGGASALCTVQDQRHLPRLNSSCDIGSVELQ